MSVEILSRISERLNISLDDESSSALTVAINSAKGCDIYTVHILQALMQNKIIMQRLRDDNIDVQELTLSIQKYISAIKPTARVHQDFTPGAKNLLEVAHQIMKHQNEALISPMHIFDAMFYTIGNDAPIMLAHHYQSAQAK